MKATGATVVSAAPVLEHRGRFGLSAFCDGAELSERLNEKRPLAEGAVLSRWGAVGRRGRNTARDDIVSMRSTCRYGGAQTPGQKQNKSLHLAQATRAPLAPNLGRPRMTPENRETRLSLGFLPPRIVKLVAPLKSPRWFIACLLTCWAGAFALAVAVNVGWL